LLCRAKRGNQNSKFGFSSKKVRILSKRYRQNLKLDRLEPKWGPAPCIGHTFCPETLFEK